MLRPSIFGEMYSEYGLGIITAILILDLIKHRFVIPGRIKKYLPFLFWFSFLWFYMLITALLFISSNFVFAVKAFILNFITVWAVALILARGERNYLFFRWFGRIMAILGYSSLITFVVSFFYPLNNLYFGQIVTPSYRAAGQIYFPFTIRYGRYTFGDFVLLRDQGVFREPGILQAFANFMLVRALNFKEKFWVILGLLMQLVFTFSTATLFLTPITLGLWHLFISNNRRKYWKFRLILFSRFTSAFMGVLLIIVGAIAFLHFPGFGFSDKLLTHETSISDRVDNMIQGFVAGLEKPFGIGLYGVNRSNAGINLVAATEQIGIIGFILAIGVYIVSVLSAPARARKKFAIMIMPLFITALVSQPLLDAPFDGSPKNWLLRRIHYSRIKFYRVIIQYYYCNDKIIKDRGLKGVLKKKIMDLVKLIFKLFSKKITIQNIHKRLENLLRKYDYYNSDIVCNYLGAWGSKEFIPRKYVGEKKKIEFEGYNFSSIEDPVAYLSKIYGDFMKLPPIEKRKSHHAFSFIELN
ncbi:LicD family protein [Thermosediminibacter oceani DSM 16646]|uniref:LicD family protein n=2 Tax=Thermosediminibacter TaxID=291988 RepID=D9S1K5_THEOJ|nr:LicD family protein [Thermosediminibacter oceani DSM 16646]